MIYQVLLDMLSIFVHYLEELWFWLVLGFLSGGLIQAFVPSRWFVQYMGKGVRSIFASTLLGVAIDVCSCGILPVAVSFHKMGASHGSVLAFLNATPWLGISILVLLYKFFGAVIAMVFIVSSVILAFATGLLVDLFNPEAKCEVCLERHGAKIDRHETLEESHAYQRIEKSVGNKLRFALRETWNLIKETTPWIFLGLAISAFIEALPQFQLLIKSYLRDDLLVAFPIAYVFSVVLFICTAGSIPIVHSLWKAGACTGVVFIMLTAGVATNFSTMGIIRKEMGSKTMILNLLGVCGSSLFLGLIIHLLVG